MKNESSGPTLDKLDQYLAKKDYKKALEAIRKELFKNPDQLNLRLRQAEILDLMGDRDKAMSIYRAVAEGQARDGFYARAIAIYKKILRLDPDQDVHSDLARMIEEDKRSKMAKQSRRRTAEALGHEAEAADQELKELQASTLFSSFTRETLVEVIASTKLRSYDQGDIVVTEGEEGSSLFLIVNGSVKVFTRTGDGSNLPLAELGPGDFFGEVSLLSGRPRTATITAGTAVSAIELDRSEVDKIAENHPEVRSVLDDFCNRRAAETVEAVIRRLRGAPDTSDPAVSVAGTHTEPDSES